MLLLAGADVVFLALYNTALSMSSKVVIIGSQEVINQAIITKKIQRVLSIFIIYTFLLLIK